jgi:hypothetical protein
MNLLSTPFIVDLSFGFPIVIITILSHIFFHGVLEYDNMLMVQFFKICWKGPILNMFFNLNFCRMHIILYLFSGLIGSWFDRASSLLSLCPQT